MITWCPTHSISELEHFIQLFAAGFEECGEVGVLGIIELLGVKRNKS